MMDQNDISSLNLNAFDSQAQAYMDYFMDVDLYNDTYDQFCGLIKKDRARILELACGPGNITRYLLRKRSDFNILATDLSPNMLKLAAANNPSARCEILDSRKIDQLNETFDGIICGFCMPYLSKEECRKLIKDSYELLNRNGVFYTSVIEDSYEKSGFEYSSAGVKGYQYYHEEGYLGNYLAEAGFSRLSKIRKELVRPNRPVSYNLILIAQK
jgi:cyclopropane fatty-acyl-phospholipid synthase-like methyltransferase